MRVTIYTTSTCPYCKLAKEFMREHSIDFKEVDVGSDSAAAKEMIEKTGQMGVPVIEIGSELIVGFDKKKLSKALGLS